MDASGVFSLVAPVAWIAYVVWSRRRLIRRIDAGKTPEIAGLIRGWSLSVGFGLSAIAGTLLIITVLETAAEKGWSRGATQGTVISAVIAILGGFWTAYCFNRYMRSYVNRHPASDADAGGEFRI